MDTEVLERRLAELMSKAAKKAIQAVNDAPDGHWIEHSEGAVRDIFQKLTSECYGELIQKRIDDLPSASQAAFSPSGLDGGSAKQRQKDRSRADRRR